MAETLTIPAGDVSVDDCGADGNVQLFKLAVSADGSAVLVPADATTGLWVHVKASALPAGAATDASLALIDALLGGGLPSALASDRLKVDGSGVTQPVSGTVGATQSGTWTIQPGNTPNTSPWLVSEQATTAGGLALPYSFKSTAAVQAAVIKASAGQVYAMHFFNAAATPAYVRLYNQTGSPGTGDSPVYRAMIPANSTNGTGFVVPIPPGVGFSSGIGIRVTGGIADTDATALAADTILGNVFYK